MLSGTIALVGSVGGCASSKGVPESEIAQKGRSISLLEIEILDKDRNVVSLIHDSDVVSAELSSVGGGLFGVSLTLQKASADRLLAATTTGGGVTAKTSWRGCELVEPHIKAPLSKRIIVWSNQSNSAIVAAEIEQHFNGNPKR